MKSERSYRQLAAIVEQQAASIAAALQELDTAEANLDTPVDRDVAVAAIARAQARLRGDQLHG